MKYFEMSEFECKCCRELPEGGMNHILLAALDKLREDYGKPIYISCGYRCPDHNREVGGVENSQHVLGNAADIYVDGDYEEFYQFVIDSELFDGIGKYKDSQFVHCDVRENGEMPNYYLWDGE